MRHMNYEVCFNQNEILNVMTISEVTVAVLGVKYLRFFICLVLIYLGSRGVFHEEDIWHEFEGGGHTPQKSLKLRGSEMHSLEDIS